MTEVQAPAVQGLLMLDTDRRGGGWERSDKKGREAGRNQERSRAVGATSAGRGRRKAQSLKVNTSFQTQELKVLRLFMKYNIKLH